MEHRRKVGMLFTREVQVRSNVLRDLKLHVLKSEEYKPASAPLYQVIDPFTYSFHYACALSRLFITPSVLGHQFIYHAYRFAEFEFSFCLTLIPRRIVLVTSAILFLRWSEYHIAYFMDFSLLTSTSIISLSR